MSVHEKRLATLQQKLPETFDALLVTSEKNITYLSGFCYTDGFLLITRQSAYLFADFRYIEAAHAAVKTGWDIRLLKGRRHDLLADILAADKIKTIGFEDSFLTCAALEGWKRELASCAFQPSGALLENMREFKDESELDNIISAQRIAEQAFEHILGYISPDRTEKEIALELEYYMRRHGAEASAFDIIAVSGKASSLPHGVPRDVKLERGFLTMDFGAVCNGYCSDMTRTVCIGHADDEMKKVYQTVFEAQSAALEMIAPGVRCIDVDRAARSLIDRYFEGCFGHGLGHGVGMYIHEAPSLSPGAGERVLQPGHVVTVEPGIYLEGRYGVRIEDMVYIHADRAEDITHCPKQLIEL